MIEHTSSNGTSLEQAASAFGSVSGSDTLVFEVALPGYDGSSDETDDLIMWIAARSREQVVAALPEQVAHGSVIVPHSGAVDLHADDIDFTLPGQAAELANEVVKRLTRA